MDTPATIPEDGLVLIQQAMEFPVDVQSVKITTPEEAQQAVNQTSEIKALAKKIDAHRKARTDAKRAEIEAITEEYRPALEFLDKAEKALKGSLVSFGQEQQRIAAAALKEQLRLDQIERDRQAALQPKAEALLVQAEEAEASGDTAQAEALEQQTMALQTSAAPISTYVPPPAPKLKGMATKKIWKCRVIDATKVPAAFCMPNEKALDAYAKTMKENAKLDGCEFYAEDSLAIK